MNTEKLINQILPQILDQIGTTLKTLTENQTLYEYEEITHGVLQRLGNLLLQGIIEYVGCGMQGPTRPCPGCAGKQSYHDRHHPLGLKTSLGPIQITERASYRCPECHASEYPLDRQLGIDGKGKMSRFLQEQIGWLLAETPMETVGETLEKFYWPHVPTSQIRVMGERLGQELEDLETERAKQIEQETQHLAEPTPIRYLPESRRLGCGTDGWMFCTNHQDERTHKYLWQEAKTQVVFELIPGQADNEEDPSEERTSRQRIAAHLPSPVPPADAAQALRYVVSTTSWQESGPRFWAELHERGAGTLVRDVVLIADGAKGMSEMIETHLRPNGITLTRILDIRHAQHHLWEVANAAFPRGDPRQTWGKTVLLALEQGNLSTLTASFQAIIDRQQEGAAEAHTALLYFTQRCQQINYPAFVAQGYPIGSGLAESACKRFGTDRMKGTGMRWTPKGAQQVATLRAFRLSARWDEVRALCRSRAA